MSAQDRAILLTPPGAAAIAVIRISGTRVAKFLAGHFSRAAVPLRCVHGDLSDGSRAIDDPVIVLHESGLTADINLHGGPWVVESVLQLLRSEGFSVVDSSVDSADGKSVMQREVAAHLPRARTEQGVRMLLAQPAAWEAFLLARPDADALRAVLDDKCLAQLLDPPGVAIVGRPNVGKSTLANQLFGQDRSITADLPGTTRDWVGEIANIDGLPVLLFDTPGLRETSDPIERDAITKSRDVFGRASLLLHIREPFDDEASLPIAENECPVITVVNKTDLLRARDIVPRSNAFFTTATTGEGVDLLRNEIRRLLGCHDLEPTRPRCWTSRQRDILEHAIDDPTVLREMMN